MMTGSLEDLFVSEAAQAIYNIWTALPREEGQICPKRFELESDSLPEAVEQHAFILAYLGETVLSVAQAGDAINAFLGGQTEGQNILARRQKEKCPIERQYYEAVFNQPCAGLMSRRTVNILGNEATFKSIHLPLLDYRNQARYALGVVAIEDRDAPQEEDASNVFGASYVTEQILVDIGAGIPITTANK